MTPDEEMQLLRLQKKNAELVAENVRLRSRVKDLQRMHNQNQNHTETLKRNIGLSVRDKAEAVFGEK